jgi:hypothetical protein
LHRASGNRVVALVCIGGYLLCTVLTVPWAGALSEMFVCDRPPRDLGQVGFPSGRTSPEHPGGFPGIVAVIGATSLPVRTIGPDLGEHTREVLASVLRLTDDGIDAVTGTSEAEVPV